MQLAISNIGWPPEHEEEVARLLASEGVGGVDVAPGLVWTHPLRATSDELHAYRDFWLDMGLEIVALQSLLYGHPELQLFEDLPSRARLREHLEGMIGVAAGIGARILVFGAPRNRRRGNKTPEEAGEIAAGFFTALAEAAEREGVAFCIEAIPVEYGADFITNSREAIDLVARVGRPGFRLLLDAGSMTLANDDPAEFMLDAAPYLRHFHISDLNLSQIGSTEVDHRPYGEALRSVGYARWASVEMRAPTPFSPEAITRSVRRARKAYFEPSA